MAYVVGGHNGSGKSTLWRDRLAPHLHVPLINADRLTLSILPDASAKGRLVPWAQRLRDEDERWQRVSQEAVRAFTSIVMAEKMAFAFETVFSEWRRQPDGTVASKLELIKNLQVAGYAVVLLFVGLASVELSIARVMTRVAQGGHSVRLDKLKTRFPRTQQAIGEAARVADVTLMFDNSGPPSEGFTLARFCTPKRVAYDIRGDKSASASVAGLARSWLSIVAP
ncbi:MAG: zeta toxin family protein [Archangium sp.]|nr:zeta toxin family protein [Archangium sp.]